MQNLRSRLGRAGGSAKSIPEFAGCCGFFAFSAFMSQSSFLTTALLSQPKPIRARPQAPMRPQSSRKPPSKFPERQGKHLFQCRQASCRPMHLLGTALDMTRITGRCPVGLAPAMFVESFLGHRKTCWETYLAGMVVTPRPASIQTSAECSRCLDSANRTLWFD